MTSSFSSWGCVLKGCFERRVFRRAKLRLKGIEDFNLEHLSARPNQARVAPTFAKRFRIHESLQCFLALSKKSPPSNPDFM